MASPKVPALLVPIYGTDPAAFAVGFLRDFKSALSDVQRRTVSRSGVKSVSINDVDPFKAGNQTKTVKTSPVGSDSPLELGARIAALCIIAGKAGIFIDEAQRKARGLPIGPKSSRGFDSEGMEIDVDEVMSDVELTAIPAGTLYRSLFGIDDAIIIGIGVPLLIALLPVILPMLMQAGKAIFDAAAGMQTPAVDPALPVGGDPTGTAGGGTGFLAGTVDVPVVGAVDKKILAGAAAVAVVLLVIVLRKRV